MHWIDWPGQRGQADYLSAVFSGELKQRVTGETQAMNELNPTPTS